MNSKQKFFFASSISLLAMIISCQTSESIEIDEKKAEIDKESIPSCAISNMEDGDLYIFINTTNDGPYSHYRDSLYLEKNNGQLSGFMPIEGDFSRANFYSNFISMQDTLYSKGVNLNKISFDSWFVCNETKLQETYYYEDKGFVEGPYIWELVIKQNRLDPIIEPSSATELSFEDSQSSTEIESSSEEESSSSELENSSSSEISEPTEPHTESSSSLDEIIEMSSELSSSVLQISCACSYFFSSSSQVLSSVEEKIPLELPASLSQCLGLSPQSDTTWNFNLNSQDGLYSQYRTSLNMTYMDGNLFATMPMNDGSGVSNSYPDLKVVGDELVGIGFSGYGESFEAVFKCNGTNLQEFYTFKDKGYEEGGYLWEPLN